MKVARLAWLVSVVSAALALGCPPQNSPSAAGEECFSAGDCEPGLICVLQRNGARLCSNDLTRVSGRPPERADPDGGDADAASEADSTGGTPDAAPVEDAGSDTGSVPDSGPVDAGDAG